MKIGNKLTTKGPIPNVAMGLSAGLRHDTTRRPRDIRAVGLDSIDIAADRRPLNEERVRELAESFRTVGLLQPIGLRMKPDGFNMRYDLIWGAHRLAAAKLLAANDPEHSSIAAAVFDEEMPDEGCRLAEIAENLHRQELTPAERAANTTAYAGWLKKLGLVQTAGQKSGKARRKDSKTSRLTISQPTVHEKMAADFGVESRTLDRRHQTAIQLAERQGLKVEGAKSLEAMSADQLIEVGDKAMEATHNESARVNNKNKSSPKKIKEPLTSEEATAIWLKLLESLPEYQRPQVARAASAWTKHNHVLLGDIDTKYGQARTITMRL